MSNYHGWTHAPKVQGGSDPIPVTPAASAPIEWICIQSTTDWDADYTHLNFASLQGNWDVGVPTFDLNGSNNLIIQKGGAYTIDTGLLGGFDDGSGTTFGAAQIGFTRVAGPSIVGSWHTWVTGVRFDVFKTTYVAGNPLSPDEDTWPFFHDLIDVPMDSDFSTPLEIELDARGWIDGVLTASGDPSVRVIVTRLGDTLV